MRFVFLFFSLFLSLSLCAQVTLKRDSSNALIIVSTLQQPDGTTVTVESAAVDSSTVKDRIFNTTLESYAAIARLEDELRNMRKQAFRFPSAWRPCAGGTWTWLQGRVLGS